MMSIDQSKPVLLVLLDLHLMRLTLTLFSTLKDMFDLSGQVLEWFRCYLKQRSQKVPVHGILSNVQFLLFSVPHDSVLVPVYITGFRQ